MNDEVEPVIENSEIVPMDTSWMGRVLLIGGVVGALTGLLGAYLLIQRSKNSTEPPALSAGEGIRLGVLVFGLLRQVSMLGED
jgi:hypothetical protein